MRKVSWVLVGILVLAFLVRLPLITGSFWMDEAAQALESMRPLNQQLQIDADFQPPLFHLVGYVMTRFSTVEWWLRMASVASGMVMIGYTYTIGVIVGGKKRGRFVGATSALLVGLSAFHVYFSQEFRQYMFAAMWGTISWYFLIRSGVGKKISKKKLLAFMLCTTAGLYSMYVYPFLLLSQIVYVAFCDRHKLKQLVFACIVSTVLFLPWAPSFLRQLKIGTTLQHSLPEWAEVVSSPQWKAIPLVWMKFLGGVRTVDFTLIDIIYFGGGTIGAGLLMLLALKKKETRPVWVWLIGSIGLAWLVSFIVPVISPKRVLFVLPAMEILIAYGISHLHLQLQKTVVVIVILFQCFGLWSYWSTPSFQREDWRAVIDAIHRQFPVNDTVVIFGFTDAFAPWRYYELRFPQHYAYIAFAKMPIQTVGDIDQTMQPALKYQRVLVFDYLRDLTDPHRSIEAWLETHGYYGIASIDTQNMGFIREYEKVH